MCRIDRIDLDRSISAAPIPDRVESRTHGHLVQVLPPSSDLNIRFWRVAFPPPPSSMLAMNTVLFFPTNLAPRGEPVICTLRIEGRQC